MKSDVNHRMPPPWTVAGGAIAALLVSTAVSAQTHYFTQDNFLYNFDQSSPGGLSRVELKLNGVTSFSGLDGRFAGLAFDPTGTLWASTANGKFYTVDLGTGAATLKFTTAGNLTTPTFDFRQNGATLEILAAQTSPGGVSNLRTFNAATGSQIGSDVSLTGGVSQNNAGDPASGYDSATNTLFVVKGGGASSDANDFTLRGYNLTSQTFSSFLQTGLTWSSAGGAWFGGQFYFAYRPGVDAGLGNWNLPTGNSTVNFGTLNTATGAYSQLITPLSIAVNATNFPITFALGTATGPSFGYAIAAIPEPETYALMIVGLGVVGFLFRRRKQAAA